MSFNAKCLMVCLTLVAGASVECFKIAAFNVQVFGVTKAAKGDVMSTLAKIIQRYDIVLIQEIRDSSQQAIYQLLDQANTLGPAEFDIEISERLGRTSSKEQYAFFYRKNAGISVLGTYQYPDADDKFEREPFAVRFKSQDTAIQDFVLAGVHIDPDVAFEEINSLVAVHTDLFTHWDTLNIVVMGDFNADCSYVSGQKRKSLLFRTEEYTWLIGDEVDTTVKSTDCAYDRIVMTGEGFLTSLVENSAQVYRFDAAYGLNSEQAAAVSDHYPVEFTIKSWSALTSGTTGLESDWYDWYLNLYELMGF